MDAATPELFEKHKGRKGFYTWEKHVAAIRQALEVFGAGNVYTYLIVGLGENDEEAVRFMQEFKEMGAKVALHSFTAVPGLNIVEARTPALARYRGIQLARYLIFEKGARLGNFAFKEGRLDRIVGIPGPGLHQGERGTLSYDRMPGLQQAVLHREGRTAPSTTFRRSIWGEAL